MLTPIRLGVSSSLIAYYSEACRIPDLACHTCLSTVLLNEPFTKTRIMWHKFVSPVDKSITGCFLWRLQHHRRSFFFYKPNTFRSHLCIYSVPILFGNFASLHLLNSGGTGRTLRCFTAGRAREISRVTHMMMRGKKNVGQEGWEKQRDRKQQRGGEKEQEEEWESLHHLCIKGVAALALTSQCASAWLFLIERSLDYGWSHFYLPVWRALTFLYQL